MTQEERTREEILKCMVANTQALTLLVTELLAKRKQPVPLDTPLPQVNPLLADMPPKGNPADQEPVTLGPPLSNPAEMNPVKQRKPRAPKPETEPSIPVTVAPVKPGKTPADLREALVSYVAKHGMPAAKEKLAPYTNISAVPDSEIDAVITRLTE